jgi:N-acetylneuraminic acid mutarotase
MYRGLLVPLIALGLIACAAEAEPTNSEYVWQKAAQRPALERTEVAGAAVGRDIYVIGGFVPPNRTTAAVERLRNGRWARVRSLPVPLNHAAAVGYRGHIYVVGGYAGATGLTEATGTLYRYDPERNRWAQLPDMPTARAALAVGVVGGRLYAVGGSNGQTQTAVLEIYDIAKRHWSRGPSFSVPREHLGGATARGRFYAVAGRNGNGNLAIVEGYDPRTRKWTRLPDIPKERGGNGAAKLGDGIVGIGGEEGGGTIGEVDRYDFSTRKWERLDPMPTPRHGLAVVPAGGRVFVVSGGPQPGFAFSNAVEILAPRR